MATMKYFLLLFLLASCATPAKVVSPTHTSDSIQTFVDANSSQGTAIVAIATANYFSSQLTAAVDARNQTATQQITNLQSTQQAVQVLSTERAWIATTTADSIQSSAIASNTASALAVQATWTQRAMDITSDYERVRIMT